MPSAFWLLATTPEPDATCTENLPDAQGNVKGSGCCDTADHHAKTQLQNRQHGLEAGDAAQVPDLAWPRLCSPAV